MGRRRSMKPMNTSTRTGPTLPCAWCGKLAYRKPSEVGIGKHIYCSRTCSNQAQSTRLRTDPTLLHPNSRSLTCLSCGTVFRIKPHRLGKAKYCSRQCFWDARFGTTLVRRNRRSMTGANNPNYRGTNNLVTARQTALTTFPKCCMLCGFEVLLRVHHIVPRHEGGTNELTNLALLCPNHHAMADCGLVSREDLKKTVLAAIAQRRDPLPLSDPPPQSEP